MSQFVIFSALYFFTGINQKSISAIRPIYTHVRDLWTLARNPIEDPDALPETRYRELMANKSLIQVYICIALSRRFLGADVLKALSYRQGANHPSRELLRRKGLELPDLANGEDPCKMKDDKMYRLFLPLTCASKLCDTIRPEDLAYRVADYIADITPWYTICVCSVCLAQSIDLLTRPSSSASSFEICTRY